MSPEAHLFASWLIAAGTTRNQRDLRLVTLAGIAPDLDGLGIVADGLNALAGRETFFYHDYHHYLLHWVFGAVAVAGFLALFARERWRVALLALIVFHLHLLCDLAGSRGPSPVDLWPIHYLGPFSREPVWLWTGQWQLDGWQNRVIGVCLLAAVLWIGAGRGETVVGVFSRRLDAIVAPVLVRWRAASSRVLSQTTVRDMPHARK
ncbi:MAG TPA: metal-dependent hydrolase [Verrucomicrobia bacterium]|nr:metal-dependent hydrolase [Verrucomicrobiota bacterium]HOP97394.1 metal-dependent hydrolase [Verrucomicrobiota bacterium]HPU55621.1 metal-dependent hydrolase [Verrucomicrobiota bacterium]